MTTISDQKMVDKTPLDLQVKSLETSMCTLIKAFKELRSIVKILEDKVNQPENKEIQNIMESQKILDIAMNENSDAIERINSEIRDLRNDKSKENVHKDDKRKTEKGAKICKYYNRGHCKYKMECRFRHSTQICKNHLEGGKCDKNVCQDRHPKVCKWWQGKSGCSRIGCDYLHGTLASDDGQSKAHKSFPCAGCKNCYDDERCVVHHNVNHIEFFLCLNCEDWIRHKDLIMNPGWSLFDNNGDLRRDV